MSQGRLRPCHIFAIRLIRPLSRPGGFISYSPLTREDPAHSTCYQRHSLLSVQGRRHSTSAFIDQVKSDINIGDAWTLGEGLTNQSKLSEIRDFKFGTGNMNALKAVHAVPETLPHSPSCSNSLLDTAFEKQESDRFWSHVPLWSDVAAEDFISQHWQVSWKHAERCIRELTKARRSDIVSIRRR